MGLISPGLFPPLSFLDFTTSLSSRSCWRIAICSKVTLSSGLGPHSTAVDWWKCIWQHLYHIGKYSASILDTSRIFLLYSKYSQSTYNYSNCFLFEFLDARTYSAAIPNTVQVYKNQTKSSWDTYNVLRLYMECNKNVPDVSRILPEYFPTRYKMLPNVAFSSVNRCGVWTQTAVFQQDLLQRDVERARKRKKKEKPRRYHCHRWLAEERTSRQSV